MKINKRISQGMMIWFLPLIIMGGIFYPLLGYLVFFMMVFLLVLSYFKARFWCSFLCPRGAFLDIVLSSLSLKRKPLNIFHKRWFRWKVFSIFITIFIIQFMFVPKGLKAVGFIFVRMCLITTLIAIILGVVIHQRVWCIICPMGTLQEIVRKMNKRKEGGDETHRD